MQAFSGKEVPLVPGTLRLYRAWAISGEKLKAFNFNYYWRDGWNEAECRLPETSVIGSLFHRHPSPHPKCTCGFYARYHPIDGGATTGVIEVAGRVILGTKGVRAERARIVAHQWIPEYVQDQYPSVKFFRNVEDMWAEYPPPDVSELIGTPEPEPRVTLMDPYQQAFIAAVTQNQLMLRRDWFKST